MVTVKITDLRLHAYHGVMAQERQVGNEYAVNVVMNCGEPADIGAETDDLSLTVNYAEVIDLIRIEMSKSSKLLEHVAWRIAKGICRQFSVVKDVSVEVIKLMPPCGVQLSGVSAIITLRSE